MGALATFLMKTHFDSIENSDEVRMWVFEETLPSGEKLTEVINRTNVKTYDRYHIAYDYTRLFLHCNIYVFFLFFNRKMLNICLV